MYWFFLDMALISLFCCRFGVGFVAFCKFGMDFSVLFSTCGMDFFAFYWMA